MLQALMVPDFSEDEDPDEALIFSPESAAQFSASPATDRGDDYFGTFSPSGTLLGNNRRSSALSPSLTRTNSALTAPRKRRRPLSRLETEVLLKMVLQDAQTRLVFRAQALVQADVMYYVPRPEDLDYPDKLQAGASGKPLVQRSLTVSLDSEDDDEPAFLSLPPPEAQETWYPTLRVTLWVLSCLYTYIDVSNLISSTSNRAYARSKLCSPTWPRRLLQRVDVHSPRPPIRLQ